MIMNWDFCEREFIKIVSRDERRTKSIVDKALIRLKIIEKIEINDDSVSFIVEGYYEVIKELLVAFLLRNGLRSKNHQCLISYFYKKTKKEKEADLISQMSYFRNRLGYYGEDIPKKFYDIHKQDFNKIIKFLLGLLKEKEVKV